MSTAGHDRWVEMISPSLDGELTAEQSRLLDEHIRGCPQCATRLAELRSLSDALRALPAERMPGSLKTEIRGRLDPPSPRAWTSGNWTVASLATLAIAGLAAVAFLGVWPDRRTITPITLSEPGSARATGDAAEEPIGMEGKAAPPAAATPSPAPPVARNEEMGRTRAVPRREDDAAAAPSFAPAPPGDVRVRPPGSAAALPDTQAGERAGMVARYATHVIRMDAGRTVLASIVPSGGPVVREAPGTPEASGERSATAAPQASLPGAAGAAPEPSPSSGDSQASGRFAETEMGAPPADSGYDERASRILAERQGPETRLFFQIQVGGDGRIHSVTPMGARTENIDVVDAVATLLAGAQVSGHRARGARLAIVEVRLPAQP